MKNPRIWGTLDPFIEGSLDGGVGGRVVGRTVANRCFLQELLRRDPFSAYHFFLGSAEQCDNLLAFCSEHFPAMLSAERIGVFPRTMLARALQHGGYHCFHLSDCMNYPAHLARMRNLLSAEFFPITSVTHSLSYSRFAKDFMAHLWQGRTARDAVVATSRTAQNVVEGYFNQLRKGYNLDPVRFSSPEVPIIPLGVDTETFVPPDSHFRGHCRQQLQMAEGRVMLLVLARLSHMSKLDVVPVLRAMQRMRGAGESLDDYCLVLAGAAEDSPSNLEVLQTYQTLASNLGLELRIVHNPSDTEKLALLAAADIFLSPSDNLQETFGLTLLEAGACGLPVVASDFDGYRDLVVHGQTGLLIPTLGPEKGAFFNAQSGVLYDNQQHLLMAQQLVVDVPSLAQALVALRRNPEMRQQMGQVARALICEEFSWQKIIELYCELWDELWLQPVNEDTFRSIEHPLDPDYPNLFGSYPTNRFSDSLRVRWSQTGQAIYRKQDKPVYYDDLQHLFDAETIRFVLFMARKECEAGVLCGRLMETKGMLLEQAQAVVLWALKQDLLEVCRESSSSFDS